MPIANGSHISEEVKEAINAFSLELTGAFKQTLVNDAYLTSDEWNTVYATIMRRGLIVPFPVPARLPIIRRRVMREEDKLAYALIFSVAIFVIFSCVCFVWIGK